MLTMMQRCKQGYAPKLKSNSKTKSIIYDRQMLQFCRSQSPTKLVKCPKAPTTKNPILLTPTFIHAPGLGPDLKRIRFLGERAVWRRVLDGQDGQRLGRRGRSHRLGGWDLQGVEGRVCGDAAMTSQAVLSFQLLLRRGNDYIYFLF